MNSTQKAEQLERASTTQEADKELQNPVRKHFFLTRQKHTPNPLKIEWVSVMRVKGF